MPTKHECAHCGHDRAQHVGVGCEIAGCPCTTFAHTAESTPVAPVNGAAKEWMPEHWTFKSAAVAANFDAHVREQLPWYDLATQAVEHIARHYVPPGGLVYDIGASTGNLAERLTLLLAERKATLVAVEESEAMVAQYLKRRASPRLAQIDVYTKTSDLGIAKDKLREFVVCGDALDYQFEMFDFATLFLVLMFVPVGRRAEFVGRLRSLIRPGGALVVVDKINTPSGYGGTVLRRLAMKWKLENGAKPEDIVKKELSLAGYQRPVDPTFLDTVGRRWFQFGEFVGWLIERGES